MLKICHRRSFLGRSLSVSYKTFIGSLETVRRVLGGSKFGLLYRSCIRNRSIVIRRACVCGRIAVSFFCCDRMKGGVIYRSFSIASNIMDRKERVISMGEVRLPCSNFGSVSFVSRGFLVPTGIRRCLVTGCKSSFVAPGPRFSCGGRTGGVICCALSRGMNCELACG